MEAKTYFAKVWEAFLAFCSGVMVILACNPLTMFLFNLFFPENAARFVHEFIGFGDFWRNFYTKSALKWPFWWSRCWMTPDNLKTCSTRKQISYYLTELNRSMVLKAMSTEALVELVKKYPDRVQEITGVMRLTDGMFAEWLEHIIEYDRTHSSDIMDMRFIHPFNKYLKCGKLPFSQVMLLTKAAVKEKTLGIYEGLMYDLYDHIERFGLNKKQLEEVAQYMCDNLYWHDMFGEEPTTESAKAYEQHKKFNHFYERLSERQINFEQRVFTRSQRGERRTDEWKAFCEKTNYICIAAQKEMDVEQYKVFHAAGRSLRSEAIMYFLGYPDRNLHRLIFRYEPLEMFDEKELRYFINDNVYLKAVFDEETAKRPNGKPKAFTAKEMTDMGFSVECQKSRLDSYFFKSSPSNRISQ